MEKVQLQFMAYCCKTIRNCKINYLKRNKPTTELLSNLIPTYDAPFQVAVRVGEETFTFSDTTLVDSLKKLSPLKRKILLYYYCAEYDDAEIAKLVQRPRSTVNYIRRKSLIELRNIYEGNLK